MTTQSEYRFHPSNIPTKILTQSKIQEFNECFEERKTQICTTDTLRIAYVGARFEDIERWSGYYRNNLHFRMGYMIEMLIKVTRITLF